MRQLLAALAASAILAAPAAGQDAPVGKLDARAEPLHYTIDLTIDPREERFSGEATITLRINEPLTTLWLHGDRLAVSEARFTPDGADEAVEAAYEQILDTGVASLTFPEEITAGEGALSVTYDAPFDDNLAGLYRVEADGEHYAVTQMAVIDARKAFPGFDEPRFKVPFQVSITAREDDAVIFNTPEVSAEPAEEGWTRRVFAETPPLPTYLIAMAVGPYDVVGWEDIPPNAVRDRAVPLRGIAAAGKGVDFDYALENTAAILSEFETYFDIPYPYRKMDLIAAPDYAFGAMENPGAIVYRESLLLIDENAPLGQRRSYALVHAHELAHMWFGDLVTPAWWDDVWLNESFATWLGNKMTDRWNPEGNFDRETLRDALDAMELDALASTRRIREPVESNENVLDAFDSITYLKGGGVLSMIESYLGEEPFRDGVRAYMAEFAEGVATADDFFNAIGDGSGRPEVVSAFRSFTDQPGVPLVTAELDCDRDRPRARVSQASYRPLGSDIPRGRRWEIPVCVAYPDGEGRAKTCALLTTRRTTFDLETDSCPSSIVPNADGAGYYRFTLDSAGWAALMNDLQALPPKEAIATADSLSAAFEAGALDALAYIDGVESLAHSPLWDVASAPAFDLLSYANTGVTGENGYDALRAFMSEVYGPLLERARAGTEDEDELLADTLTAVLVRGARDEALIAELAEQGEAFLAGGAELGVEGGPPAYALSDALTATMWTNGETLFEDLLQVAKDASNPVVRLNAIAAVARIREPKLAERVRQTALEGDALTGRELFSIVNYQLALPETRADAWTWLQTNFEAFVERIPDARRSQTPALVQSFSTRAQATEAEAFFTENAALIPGYERSLTQTLEAIELRRALARRQGARLGRALQDRMEQ